MLKITFCALQRSALQTQASVKQHSKEKYITVHFSNEKQSTVKCSAVVWLAVQCSPVS